MIVIPRMVKGGFIVGAKHGRGAATCRQANGQWTAPAFITITGGSWGAQIGVEAVDLVLAVMNKGGMDALLDSNFQLGAHGAVAAGPIGREAEASQGGAAEAGVLAYSRTKGLFVGLTLEGAYVRTNDDLNRAYYGRPVRAQTILAGEVSAPQSASLFLNPIRSAARQAARE
jgi:lipid-binding SYLF domain-containing protein